MHFNGSDIRDDQTREIKLIFEDPSHYQKLLDKIISHDKMLGGGITKKMNEIFEKLTKL